MKKNRHSDGRLRVSGGYAGLALLTIAATLAIAPHLRADEPAGAPPRMLLAAHTAAWDFDILVSSGSAPLEHDFSRCGVTSAAKVKLAANAAVVLRDPVVCVSGFALLPAPASPASAETVVTFGDGVTAASFTLPALGALYNDSPAVIDRAMVSDDREGVWITVIPKYDNTPLYAVLWDARNPGGDPIIEKFKASPPIAQHRIEAKGVFWVEVFLGTDPLYRCFPSKTCDVVGPVYGFVSNGTEVGGSFRVSPFGGS